MAIKVGDGVLRISTDGRYFCCGIVISEGDTKGWWRIKFCDGIVESHQRESTNYYRNAFKKMMKDVE